MSTTDGESDAVRLRVDVVLDPASLGHTLASIANRHHHGGHLPSLIRPNLLGLIWMFERRGFDVAHLTVVVPRVPVRLGPSSDPENARTTAAQWADWIEAEQQAVKTRSDCALEVLHGAFDGNREVGVDELVAWAALQRTTVATTDGDDADGDRPVIVVSADGDMWDLWRWAAPRRLFVAAGFDADHRRLLRDSRIPSIYLDDAGLMTCVPGRLALEVDHPVLLPIPDRHPWLASNPTLRPGDVVLTNPDQRQHVVLGGQWSAPLNRPASTKSRPRSSFAGVNTVAVVDPYGIRNQALRAIGIARLPRPHNVRTTLADLHFPGPAAVHFVIPDLERGAARDLPRLLQRAWNQRDGEFDALTAEVTQDGDVTTRARRASVRIGRMANFLRRRRTNDNPESVKDQRLLRAEDDWRGATSALIKRLSTNVIAELWSALHRTTDTSIAVVSEDPDVYWALGQIHSIDQRLERVTRVGLHARRVTPLTTRDQIDPPPFVLLTERLIAQMCDVTDSPFARSHRGTLADAVHNGAEWEVIGLDPESGGLVVRHETTPGDTAAAGSPPPDGEPTDAAVVLESVLHPGEVAIDAGLVSLLDGLGTSDTRVDLLFDPYRTCSVPQLRLTRRAPVDGSGYVVSRDGGHLQVDIDGDGTPDTAVPVGHDTTVHPPGERIVLRQLQGKAGGWVLTDPGPEPTSGAGAPPEIVDLAAASAHDTGERTLLGADGSTVRVLPVPGETQLIGTGRILASRLGDEPDGSPTLLAISSEVGYLQDRPATPSTG